MYFKMSKSSSGPQTSSTPMDTSRVEEFYVNIEDESIGFDYEIKILSHIFTSLYLLLDVFLQS